MSRKSLFIQVIVMLAVAFGGAIWVYKSQKSKELAQAIEVNQPNLVRFHSPTLGNPAAKVHIVEFLDPACEACRSFYRHVKEIMAANPDKVRLSIRHVPFHAGSDYVVKVLDAARKQGKYWQALEALLTNQPSWTRNHTAQPDLVWRSLEGLGLNLEQLKADMEAPETAKRVIQDLEDAKALGVTKTPTFFVNGRPLPSHGLDHLQTAVNTALAAAY